jgi:hypothetical protein
MVTTRSRADMKKGKATHARATMNKGKHGGCVMSPLSATMKKPKWLVNSPDTDQTPPLPPRYKVFTAKAICKTLQNSPHGKKFLGLRSNLEELENDLKNEINALKEKRRHCTIIFQMISKPAIDLHWILGGRIHLVGMINSRRRHLIHFIARLNSLMKKLIYWRMDWMLNSMFVDQSYHLISVCYHCYSTKHLIWTRIVFSMWPTTWLY